MPQVPLLFPFYHRRTGLCWWLGHIWIQILPHSYTHCEFPPLSVSHHLPNSKKRKLWASWCWHQLPCTTLTMSISYQKGEILYFIPIVKQDKTALPPHYSFTLWITWMNVHNILIYRFREFHHEWGLRGHLIELPFFEKKTRQDKCGDTPGSRT